MDRVHGRNDGGAGGKSIYEKTFTRQQGIVTSVLPCGEERPGPDGQGCPPDKRAHRQAGRSYEFKTRKGEVVTNTSGVLFAMALNELF
jgi:hypothetical protein